MTDWPRYQHPDAGFALRVPPSWERAEDVLGCAAVFRMPVEDPDLFQPNLTVALPLLDETPSLEEFSAGQLTQASRLLTDVVVLDVDDAVVADFPAARVLFTYRQGIYSLTLEQWWAVAGEGAVVLSATVGTFEYAELADVFTEMVASFEVADGG